MSVLARNNVQVSGKGPPMVFVHGFGCDQSMWRFLAPHFAESYTCILMVLVGSGRSDLAAYDLSQSPAEEIERLRDYILQAHRRAHPELHTQVSS